MGEDTVPVLYCAHLCMKYSLGITNFLEEISSLSYSIVFLYFFSLCSFICGILKIKQNSECNFSKDRLTDIKNKPMVTSGKREGRRSKTDREITSKNYYCKINELQHTEYSQYFIITINGI